VQSATPERQPNRWALRALFVAALLLALGSAGGLLAVVLMAAEFALLAWLCVRQIGGQTGDVLGALEQVGEMTILLVAAATVAA